MTLLKMSPAGFYRDLIFGFWVISSALLCHSNHTTTLLSGANKRHKQQQKKKIYCQHKSRQSVVLFDKRLCPKELIGFAHACVVCEFWLHRG